MFEESWWLWGAALPVVVSAAVMVVCLQPWRPASPIRTAIAWPLALALGYAVGSVAYAAYKQSLVWPPVEATDFLAMVVLPAAVLVEIVGTVVGGRAPVVRWVGRAVVIVGTPPLMLLPFLKNWSVGVSVGVCAGLAVAMAVEWVSIDLAVSQRLTDRDPLGRGYEDERESLAPWLALMIAAAGVGVTILTSGSVTLGQLGLTLAAALFGAWVVGVVAKPQAVSGGGGGVAVVLLAGLLINGCFYAEVKPWHAAVLAAAPLAAWVGRAPAVQKLRGWQIALIVAVATGLVVAAAVIPAAMAAARAMSENGYE